MWCDEWSDVILHTQVITGELGINNSESEGEVSQAVDEDDDENITCLSVYLFISSKQASKQSIRIKIEEKGLDVIQKGEGGEEADEKFKEKHPNGDDKEGFVFEFRWWCW